MKREWISDHTQRMMRWLLMGEGEAVGVAEVWSWDQVVYKVVLYGRTGIIEFKTEAAAKRFAQEQAKNIPSTNTH